MLLRIELFRERAGRTMMIGGGTLKLLALVGILIFYATSASAEISVTPAAPNSADAVYVVVSRDFGAPVTVTASSVTRNGNVITITQDATSVCNLPLPSSIRSEFTLTPLPPGSYQVNWILLLHGSPLNSCGENQATSSLSFVVTDVRAIPALSEYALAFLAAAFVAIAGLAFRR